ncbi:hypothetical protein L204_105745 [Cryptococcus depauperatus]
MMAATWRDALDSSLNYLKALLISSSSSSWKPVSVASASSNGSSSKLPKFSNGLGTVLASDVLVHRRSDKYGDVYRAVAEVDCGSDISIDAFRGCLVTPETRRMWDCMVEEAVTLDFLDAHTRVIKTNYRLGWPSSPRDTVTISKTLADNHTLIDISTSLPRSRHEPAYLRSAPPYVRAHVSLLAWCVQLPSSTIGDSPPDGKTRISCFWNWNPNGTWAVGSALREHLPSLLVNLVNYMREGSSSVPVLLGYGPNVSIGTVAYDPSRVTLDVHYAIIDDCAENQETEGLRRQIEFGLSSEESWDVQVKVKAQLETESSSTMWSCFVGQAPALSPNSLLPKRLIVRFSHVPLKPEEELVRASVSIERTTSSSAGVRINGIPMTIECMEPPPSFLPDRPLLEETASITGLSLETLGTSVEKLKEDEKQEKEDATQKEITSLIKRNYIYFTSLLQEPEPKWKPILDSRGVAIHQLDSIDRTLIVYRAEAVFVGVGIWDLFAVVANPGTRCVWEKTHEDAVLVEDVNELTDIWHLQSKAAWPIAARDNLMLRTTYKSPSSVHIFGFSIDDTSLFPSLPPSLDPSIIRTQIDLQGWSIESLSPNTTQVTLLEQSDPRGWAGKSSIPVAMMSALTGIGDFAIKHGGPPVCTRLEGGKAISSKYDAANETFKFEYVPARFRRITSSSIATSFPSSLPSINSVEAGSSDDSSLRTDLSNEADSVECEIRCDADQWSSSLSIVIDPPQKAISALRRHKLSPNGGGLWLTIKHDQISIREESGFKVSVTVRKGPQILGSKTQIIVNGSKIKVDLEDLPEAKVQLLKKQKRGRPTRAPLDQPPGLGLRKKLSTTNFSQASPALTQTPSEPRPVRTFPKTSLPLLKWYSYAIEATRSALVPIATSFPSLSVGVTPVEGAVSGLKQLARIHADRDGESTTPASWLPVTERDGLKVEKKVIDHVSEIFPVFRAGRIIEGYTAEEVSSAISVFKSDERFEKPVVLAEYGCGIKLSHVVAHTTFPFKERSMLLATVVAKLSDRPPPSPSLNGPRSSLSTIFHASTSCFDPITTGLDPLKYNKANFYAGNIILEGWILETIDPYSHEQYAIPSTRCMYLACVDYSCGMPLSVNNMLNSSLPRSLLAAEALLKSQGPPSRSKEPGMMVLAPEDNSKRSNQGMWALKGAQETSLGIDERNEDGEYNLTVIIQPSGKSNSHDQTSSPTMKHVDSGSSVHTGLSTVIDTGEEIRKGKKDLVIMEVEIGREGIKKGCEIELMAVSLPVALHSTSLANPRNIATTTPASDGILSFDLPPPRISLPFKPAIISLVPSVLQTASLDPTLPSRHLLRVTLPTSSYDFLIDDPLTEPKTMLPRPRWLLDLMNDGAVVKLRLKPHQMYPIPNAAMEDKKSTAKEIGAVYIYEGKELTIQDEKRAKHFGLQDGAAKQKIPQLIYCSAPVEGDEDITRRKERCKILDKPLAVKSEFLKDMMDETANMLRKDEAVDHETRANKTDDDKPVQTLDSRPSNAEQPRYTYNFWKYSRLPFSASAPNTAVGSPTRNHSSPPLESAIVTLKERENVEKEEPSAGNIIAVNPKEEIKPVTSPGFLRPVTSLPGLVIACVLSFLLGSLLRSLLSEADFVVYLPPSLTGVLPSVQLERLGTGPGYWRELKRLAEWRIGWDQDLILAIARRN